MKKIALILLALGIAKEKHKRKHKHCCKKKPPPPFEPIPLIVGTWLFNETISDIGSFSVLSAHTDGIVTTHRSLSIKQPVPANFPTGNFTTVETGIWRERATTVFQLLATSVVNVVTTGIPVDLAGTTPFARTKIELTARLSDDGNSMSISGTITLYEMDDLTLTKPLLDQNTGLPFVSNVASVGERLQFSLLDRGP